MSAAFDSAEHLHRIAPAVVLAVGEEHDRLVRLRAARGLPREQVVRQRETVADRGLPFALQNLIVHEVDVAQQVVVVEGQRADDVGVVGEDDRARSGRRARDRTNVLIASFVASRRVFARGRLDVVARCSGVSPISSCMLDDRSRSTTMSRPRDETSACEYGRTGSISATPISASASGEHDERQPAERSTRGRRATEGSMTTVAAAIAPAHAPLEQRDGREAAREPATRATAGGTSSSAARRPTAPRAPSASRHASADGSAACGA